LYKTTEEFVKFLNVGLGLELAHLLLLAGNE